ncbi:methyltransferase domain-containing protein [Mesorhizobium sp. L-8-3]|uniref:methyltransferase domain-containing protein n=1 Tax=Mesorhizobium sp. L-8-3 TaxID=2744522 RepID=UPI001927DFB7|nr:methyltransferase domain-containing protein [Mesorhizobium sp. L-8-3]BCH27603.1 hypothetical protein MesoLjLb_73880 [Mesorhizobium sp. L-8-3]
MRPRHFETLRPICPVCRAREVSSHLAINIVEAGTDDEITAGILGCPNCGAEYPVIDGLPVILPDVRRYVQDNLFYLLARRDLTPAVESLIGDASGPGSAFDSIRQHVSSYVWDHWGDQDPAETGSAAGNASPGSVARVLAGGLDMISDGLASGPVLDMGCGAGRSVAELAARTGRTVLGIDVSTPLARVARRAVVHGHVDYARRRVGLVYDRRAFGIDIAGRERMDVWICDVQALPFEPATFALAVGLNLLDCLGDPQRGLAEIGRVLCDDGKALLAVPFDWTGHVTAVEGWIGGHSQRGPHGGSAEAILDGMLSEGALSSGGLRKLGPAREIPWHVRLHERSCMHYDVHVVAARRDSAAGMA